MVLTCSECGAPIPDGGHCRDYFHELLLLESQVPSAPGGLPHFLAVASYNLQHPAGFMPAALVGLRTTVAEVLAGAATLEDARRRARRGAAGTMRVVRRPDTVLSEAEHALLRGWPTTWPLTVLDVCRVPPERYVERVRAWAEAVVAVLNVEVARS